MNEDNPMSALADKKPPVESAKALAAYSDYEALGPDRSYPKLVAKYAKSTSYVNQIKRWAGWYDWQSRLRLHEEKQLEARRKKRQAELEKMDEEHAVVGHHYMIQALARIDQIIKEGTLPAAVAVSLLKTSYELERIARGAATARLEASGPDGGPLVVNGTVGFYPVMLPQKDAPPDTQIGQPDEP